MTESPLYVTNTVPPALASHESLAHVDEIGLVVFQDDTSTRGDLAPGTKLSSHRKYFKVVLQKSTPPKIRQLILHYY